ncbi:MAG: hypothetical protein K2Z81_04130 [Cyanobacteria bacterium]|nr:hypothetical protein [Cyanobacteriota bacterium]
MRVLKRALIVSCVLSLLAPRGTCAADDSTAVVFKALTDEMNRSLTQLKLPGHSSPYFIDYTMYENDDFSVEANLGALVSKSRKRERTVFPNIRVGSYQMDNSNFKSSVIESGSSQDSFAPVDDNYYSIRRALWLLSDSAYKTAVETFEEKKAYLLENNVADKLPDFRQHEPLDWIKPVQRLSIEDNQWADRARRLSGRFREFPKLYDSSVRYDERVLNSWLVNSEGTKVSSSESAVRLLLSASIRAQDGSPYDDFQPYLAFDRSKLPPEEVIEKEVTAMADRLSKLSQAPTIDYYEGPVLFEGQAAAEFFGQVLSPYIKVKRQKISDRIVDMSNSNPFAKKLSRRVMTAGFTVSDQPLTRFYQGQALFGGFDVDEEGVKAQSVTIIEDGVLKTLLAGRTPTDVVAETNGHGRFGTNNTLAKNSSLFIACKTPVAKSRLYKRLREEGKAAGLDHVFVIRRLSNGSRDQKNQAELYSTPGIVSLSRPLLMYRLSVATGEEELVRGAEFAPMTLRVLKDIVAAGDQPQAHPVEETANNYFHVVSPSVIVRDVEMERSSVDEVKAPVIPSPLMDR